MRKQSTPAAAKSKANRRYAKEYCCWYNMRVRCFDPGHQAYQYYGGRGITICDSWLDSFDAFLADMGPAPSPDHTIDRIDPNGHYCPENCRWATPAEQGETRRNALLVIHEGKPVLLADLARRHGVAVATAYVRVWRGWDAVKAATTPVRRRPRPPRVPRVRPEPTTPDGSVNVTDAARNLGLSRIAIYGRLRRGWTMDEATTIPKGRKPRR